MTKEEKKTYNREYRAEGFGKIADRKYRNNNIARLREYARKYAAERRARDNDRREGGQ